MGAQAFSNFDTLLAPFVKKDNLSYKEVKQCIQSFVFGLNTPSRWGCVPETYKVMTTRGWKGIDELKPGDTLYTWKNGKLNLCKNNATVIKEHDGELLQFTNPHYKYKQEVTDYHRCLVCKTNKKLEEAVVMTAGDLASDPFNHNYSLPTGFTEVNVHPGIDLSDDEIRFAAMIYTDGTICHYGENSKKLRITYFKSVKRNAQIHAEEVFNRLGIAVEPKHYYTEMSHEFGILKWEWYGETARQILDLIGSKQVIHERFFEMNQRQAKLFLDTWMMHDGLEEKKRAQVDNYIIRDQLLFINVLAGNISSHWSKMLPSGASVNYVKQTQVDKVKFEVSTRRYKGRVWCPSSDDGTAIFMNDRGGVFISANCQAPFTNVSIDWTCPKDFKDLPAIVKGEEQDFTYGDCEKEQALVNKAFIEVMIEGDCNGRGMQYPIPSYSITKDFKWDDSENNQLLFGMAAKYGIPYFSNYINSDMDPSDVRSMAFLPSQEFIYKNALGQISKMPIRHLVDQWLKMPEFQKPAYEILMNGKFVKVIDMFEVPYDKINEYVKIYLDNGYEQPFSMYHKCIVYRDGSIQEVESQNIRLSDKMVFSKQPWNNHNGIGTYEAGLVLGYYLAEGWVETHSSSQVTFAINIKRTDIVDRIVSFFKKFGCAAGVDEYPNVHIFKVKVFGKQAVGFVQNYISGACATMKHFVSTFWNTSDEFRRGVLDGYVDTDGCPSDNSIAHTTNKELCFDLIRLGSSLGEVYRYGMNDKNTRYFKPDKSDLIHFTSYRLRKYQCEEFDGFYLVPVKEVKILPYQFNSMYNFTVDTPDHRVELPNGMITHQCCRLRLDLREVIKKNGGGLFGAAAKTGSIGVVTLNMARLGYLANDEEDFFKRLDHLMDVAARSLNIKRKVVTQLLDNGLYPYMKRYLGSFKTYFSTLATVGMNEMCLNAKWLRAPISDKKGQEFTIKTLKHMVSRIPMYQQEYGALYNLESAPAESTCFRLAKHDKEKYPDIITAGTEKVPYYTNSSNMAVGTTANIYEALENQDPIQILYTSGTVFHAYLGERLPDWKTAATIIKKICENYRLPYITLSPTYSICPEHGYIAGEHHTCPICTSKQEDNMI